MTSVFLFHNTTVVFHDLLPQVKADCPRYVFTFMLAQVCRATPTNHEPQ